METATTAFLVTLAIVGGILSPIILVLILSVISNLFKALAERLNLIVENTKKAPPFDDVEVNVSPVTRVATARFIKNGVVIWQGDVPRRDLE